MQVLHHLLCEPVVQLFRCVQHEAFSLGGLFAVGHQSAEVIPFKQARDLQKHEKQALCSTNALHPSHVYLLLHWQAVC